MRSCRSLPKLALTILLSTPIFLQKGYANATSLITIASSPLTAVAQAQTRGDRKAGGDLTLV